MSILSKIKEIIQANINFERSLAQFRAVMKPDSKIKRYKVKLTLEQIHLLRICYEAGIKTEADLKYKIYFPTTAQFL